MATPEPAQPNLDDVRDVLRLVLMLLSDSSATDGVLDTLRAGAGERNDELGVVPAPEWAAANRFVLDALIDGMGVSLGVALDDPPEG